MAKLNRVKVLSKSDFKRYPIWVWDDAREYKIPIIGKNPSWQEFEVFFIKAKFKTDKHVFDGYLVGNRTYFAFTLFIGLESVKFNANSDSLNKSSLEKLFEISGFTPFDFFPIEYESSVLLKGWKKLAGKFVLVDKKMKCIQDP